MAHVGIGPIKQAFVRALRDITALKAAVGSDGIDEGISLTGVSFPRVMYVVRPTSPIRQFGGEAIAITTIDCWAVSDSQVEAQNLDQLMLDGLEDKVLDFTGISSIAGNEPTTLLCHRLRSMSLVEADDAGKKVFLIGGTYQIWTDRL